MPKARGKKNIDRVNENIRPNMYGVNISPELDLAPGDLIGLGVGSKGVLGKPHNDPLEEQSMDMGVNEILESCYKDIHNNIQAKKHRMEQFVTNALASSDAKFAHCSMQANNDQNELRECLPMRPKDGSDILSNIIKEGTASENTVRQVIDNGRGFEHALRSVIEGFSVRADTFLNVIDRQETKQRSQTVKMQQELKNDIAVMEKNMEKNMLKNKKKVLQNHR